MHRTAALLLGLLLAAGCTEADHEAAGPEPASTGMPAPVRTPAPLQLPFGAPDRILQVPDVALATARGDTIRLSERRGEVVVLHFWATWCPPCIREMPGLGALHQELQEEGLTVVGVSVDERGMDAVRPFLAHRPARYPVVLDDGSLAAGLGGIWSLPTTFVIGREGYVVRRFTGAVPPEEMRAALTPLL